jgi:3',5'-cyclic AMP phosphodiesterase CpdA
MPNARLAPKSKWKPAPARLFMILARKSPTAVIFRRGPSHWVQLIKWNTETDGFEFGQWFHGRIYERRADLSPDGSLLIYFAQKISVRTLKDQEFKHSWTAISKAPYFTALALWPKGQNWDGGGLFKDNKTVLLNHEKEVANPHPSHMPGRLHVILKDCHYGGDEPIFSERLERDGWTLRQEWKKESGGTPYRFRTIQPEIREKMNGSQMIRLTRSIELNDYPAEFTVVSKKGSVVTKIDRAGWVDWDQKGRLVYARDGGIFRGDVDVNGRITERQLLDLNSSKPNPVVPPHWATTW